MLPQKTDDVITLDNLKNDEDKSTTQEISPPTTPQRLLTSLLQKPYDGKKLMEKNDFSYADSLFEPHTFGFPSFVEDQFKHAGHQPYFSNSMLQMIDTDDNCCHLDKLMGTFTEGFQCIEEYFVPEENLFC